MSFSIAKETATLAATIKSFQMENASASVVSHWTAAESVSFPAHQTNSFTKEAALLVLSTQFSIHKSTDAPAPLDTTKIPMEYANNLSLNLSIALQDNTLIATQDVLPALALAKLANQPPSASPASLMDTHLIQMECASLLVEMASFWEDRLVILDWPTQLVASAAESKTTGAAQDNLQCVSTTLPHLHQLHLRQ
jgi:hypothetical protein